MRFCLKKTETFPMLFAIGLSRHISRGFIHLDKAPRHQFDRIVTEANLRVVRIVRRSYLIAEEFNRWKEKTHRAEAKAS